MDRPMTTQEFFNRICDILEEKGKMPDILEYRIATSRPVPIRIYEFKLSERSRENQKERLQYLAAGTAGTTAPQKTGYGAITDRAAG